MVYGDLDILYKSYTMINSIFIRNVASYCSQGITINGLGKANFIYGANGCGKTTISNYFLDPSSDRYVDCSHIWQSNLELEVLVYNKEFRERNFGEGSVKGIFTLGEATKEDIEFIEEKSTELKGLKATLKLRKEAYESKCKEKEKTDHDFRENVWKKVYKKNEIDFKPAFFGSISKKEIFAAKLIQEYSTNESEELTRDILLDKAKTLFGPFPAEKYLIQELIFDNLLDIERDYIWSKIIVGSADVDIAKMIQSLNINDWVDQGRKFIKGDTCPFCQKNTIDSNLKSQLEVFFNEEYIKDIEKVRKLVDDYGRITENIINFLGITEDKLKQDPTNNINMEKFSSCVKTFISIRNLNMMVLMDKLKEPSRSFALKSLEELLIELNNLFKVSNEKNVEHNRIVNNFKTEKDLLINAIWKFLCLENVDDIRSYINLSGSIEKAINGLKAQVDRQINEISKVDKVIQEKSKNITSIEPAVNNINTLLRSYGFTNFRIVPYIEDGYYQIEREDGALVENTLSEGEVTFLTFLYYLYRARGGDSTETVNNERILVIDDPISSLDSNVLFIVSTLLKELIKNIKIEKGNIAQIIILTHNVYFHKEVSFEGLQRKGEKNNFWILRKNAGISSIHSYLHHNPIQSSYELLWRELREWENNSATTIQNTMRRILENFFSILGSRRDEFIIGKFENHEEKEICRSLISWINEGSHTLPDDFFVEYPHVTVENYLKVFKDIFYHTDNSGHYDMMMNEGDSTEQSIQLKMA